MNAEIESDRPRGACVRNVWLLSIRLVLVLAWSFNFVVMAAAVLSAMRGEDSGRLLGVGFVFVWLLLTGMIVVRTSATAPQPAPRS